MYPTRMLLDSCLRFLADVRKVNGPENLSLVCGQ